MEQPRAQCDACGHDLDERESPVVYDCFHALHAACTYGGDACPLPFCLAPRTRPAAPEVGAGGAPSSPPDSSVAGQMRGEGDGPSAGAGESRPPPIVWCDVCGGRFRPSEIYYWKDECPHCMLPPMPGIPWSPPSFGGSFGSPPPSPSHVDQFVQPPPATAGPAAPPQPAHTGPFEQPPPTTPPANQFGFSPPAQFGAPPPYFFNYYYSGMFQRPPPAVPYAFVSPRPPHQTGQFAGCPAPSLPSQAAAPFQQPPPPSQAAFGSPYAFPPVAPPPSSHYPLQTRTFEYHHQQQLLQPPAPARFAYAPPAAAAAAGSPSCCAACCGAVVRGQTTVTSQCNHTFHFRCFAGSPYACPACGALWGDVGPVSQPPPYRY